MSLKLEKILTISAGDYIKMYGKKWLEYEATGIHCVMDNDVCGREYGIECFAKKVPKEAEVVVAYRLTYKGYLGTASGTALIPKTKNKF